MLRSLNNSLDNAAVKGNIGAAKGCCGYADGADANGYDCLVIPSAVNAKSELLDGKLQGHFCGNGGLVSKDTKAEADAEGMVTICCKYHIYTKYNKDKHLI